MTSATAAPPAQEASTSCTRSPRTATTARTSGSRPRRRCPARGPVRTPVYDRGAMTLQALRAKVGDRTFFGILRAWYRENRYRNVTTADFIALAERGADSI